MLFFLSIGETLNTEDSRFFYNRSLRFSLTDLISTLLHTTLLGRPDLLRRALRIFLRGCWSQEDQARVLPHLDGRQCQSEGPQVLLHDLTLPSHCDHRISTCSRQSNTSYHQTLMHQITNLTEFPILRIYFIDCCKMIHEINIFISYNDGYTFSSKVLPSSMPSMSIVRLGIVMMISMILLLHLL